MLMLTTRLTTVVRYFLRLRFRFFAAITPPMPNSLFVSGLTRSSRRRVFTSCTLRIASTGGILAARTAGSRAEKKMVTAENTAPITSTQTER